MQALNNNQTIKPFNHHHSFYSLRSDFTGFSRAAFTALETDSD